MKRIESIEMPYVIVNRTVVVKDSKVLKGVFPGQPIRNRCSPLKRATSENGAFK